MFVVRANAPERWWHPAQVFENTDLARLEEPNLPPQEDRMEWAARLAACQWTLYELAHGLCWTKLKDHIS